MEKKFAEIINEGRKSGKTIETINKELKALERAGMVQLAYGRIVVRDAQRLRTVGDV